MAAQVGGEQDEGHDDGQRVGRGGGRPNAVQAPQAGADVEGRYEEQHLPRQAQEDGQRDFADGLEIIARHDLEAHEREEREHKAHTGLGDVDERFVLRKQARQHARHPLHADEPEQRDGGGHTDGQEQGLPHAVHAGGAEVITHDGLHGVAQP